MRVSSWKLGIGSWELIVSLLVVGCSLPAYAQAPSGEAIYKRRCATCHEKPADGRTPGIEAIRNMPSSRIVRTLDFGAMMTIAYQLNRAERDEVARYLGKPGGDAAPRREAFCTDRSVSLNPNASPIWNGWSPSPNNSRFSPAALSKLAVVDDHAGLGEREAREHADRVQGDQRAGVTAERDDQPGRDQRQDDDAVRVHEAVAAVGQLARQVAVLRDERRHPREVGERGVGREDQDGEGRDLQHEVHRTVAEHVTANDREQRLVVL